MIQGGEDLRFALKASQPVGVSRQRGWENLDGDLALQLRVRRAIDLTHAASADGGEDLVRAKMNAGAEGHGLSWIIRAGGDAGGLLLINAE